MEIDFLVITPGVPLELTGALQMTRKYGIDRDLDPTTSKKVLASWRRLIAALLKNSIQDAKRGDLEAVDWLQSEGIYWLDWLGIKQPGIGVERILDPPGKMVIRVGGCLLYTSPSPRDRS